MIENEKTKTMLWLRNLLPPNLQYPEILATSHTIEKTVTQDQTVNPILHTAWLNSHALTSKSNTAKYYFGKKSSFLHTFLKFCCESRKI